MIKKLEAAGTHVTEDDAMFTKKYVGPVDCASCDKGIINLNGMRAEHLNWNRLPFREPNERIAKVSVQTFYVNWVVRIRFQQILGGFNFILE
jgi:hypothetical protein